MIPLWTADEKQQMFLSIYKDGDNFLQTFSACMITDMIINLGKEELITNDYFPSLTLAVKTFSIEKVKTLLMSYLYEHCTTCNLSATAKQIEKIADDMVIGYGNLKITEIALFFNMLRSGYFRSGENDRAKMYGSISEEVIMDCLHSFRNGYRCEIIERHRQDLAKKKREEDEMRAASYQEKFEVLTAKCLQDPEFLDLIKENKWLMEQDIRKIETYVEEFKHLRLLRTRVAEYIKNVNDGADPKTNIKVLEKANDFLNEKYPNQTN